LKTGIFCNISLSVYGIALSNLRKGLCDIIMMARGMERSGTNELNDISFLSFQFKLQLLACCKIA